MRRRLIFLTLSVLAVLGGKAAAEDWRVERMEAAALPPKAFREWPAGARWPARRLVATAEGGDIAEAWYGGPTRRYGHAILGDAVEAGALVARTVGGAIVTLWLPATEVFEDRTPRLADLDGDGRTEIVTIRSSLTKGAAVTVYGLEGGALKQRATTDFIGRSNRWLNIAAIADLDGTPGLEIAHVRTPHIGGTLIVHGYRDGALVRIAALDGFSNHRHRIARNAAVGSVGCRRRRTGGTRGAVRRQACAAHRRPGHGAACRDRLRRRAGHNRQARIAGRFGFRPSFCRRARQCGVYRISR